MPLNKHPADDGGPEYILDVPSVVGMVSSLVQILIALIGPDKAKESIDHEVARQIQLGVTAANTATDVAADAIEEKRFG